MNTGGAAHIMNDEATRKYLQAIKRLLTVMQRLYPTDPSRAMDFDGYKAAERGAAGGGSDKLVRIIVRRRIRPLCSSLCMSSAVPARG